MVIMFGSVYLLAVYVGLFWGPNEFDRSVGVWISLDTLAISHSIQGAYRDQVLSLGIRMIPSYSNREQI